MKKTLYLLSLFAIANSLQASVPLKWTVETSRVQPAQFDAYHGETLDLEATFLSYGSPLALPADADCRIFWQTNGMGNVYWSTNAVLVSSNAIAAVFRPTFDPGATTVLGFVGIPASNYRAAFTIRFRGSPGAVPSELPLPAKVIDFAQVDVRNAPWLTVEADPTVPSWAKSPAKPTYTAQEIGAVPYANAARTAVRISALNTAQSTDGGGTLAIGRNTRALADSSFAGGHRAMTADDTKYGLSFGNRTYASTGATALGYQAWASQAGQFAGEDSDVVVGLLNKCKYSFVWQGKDDTSPGYYHAHGDGTFNINPIGGVSGFWIGEKTLPTWIGELSTYTPSPSDPAFSNAVLAVETGINTNDLAALRSIAGLPLSTGAGTVAGILAALVAAVLALQSGKLDKTDVIKQAAVTDSTPDGKAADAKDIKTALAGKLSTSAKLSDLRDEAGNPTTENKAVLTTDGGLKTQTAVYNGTITLDHLSESFTAYDANSEPYLSKPPTGGWKGPFGPFPGQAAAYIFWVPSGYADPTTEAEAIAEWCIYSPDNGVTGFLMYKATAYANLGSLQRAAFSSPSAPGPAPYAIVGQAFFTRASTTQTKTFATTAEVNDRVSKIVNGAQEITPTGGVADVASLFSCASSVTKPTPAGLLNNAELESSVMAVANSLLPYPINTAGTILDRAINVVTSGAWTIPSGFKDLLIRYTGTPTSLTFAETGITDYGDDLPSESGDYLVTVTRIKASEAYIRVVKLEGRN